MSSKVCKHHQHPGRCLLTYFWKGLGSPKKSTYKTIQGTCIAGGKGESIASNRHTGLEFVPKGLRFKTSSSYQASFVSKQSQSVCITGGLQTTNCMSICVRTCP